MLIEKGEPDRALPILQKAEELILARARHDPALRFSGETSSRSPSAPL